LLLNFFFFTIVSSRVQMNLKKRQILGNKDSKLELENENFQSAQSISNPLIYEPKKDKYYIVYVKNPFTSSLTNSTVQKRNLNNEFIDELVNDIHTLIVDNKDTYENPEKLDEIDKKEIKLRKRKVENEYLVDNKNSNYVYKFSSTETKTALYAYLSDSIVKTVETMENVISCVPDIPLNITFDGLDNFKKEILKETGWNGFYYRKNAKSHLSIISQGKYDSSVINSYDDTYYYPKPGGEGIDVLVVDVGFNFKSSEFDKTSKKCCLGGVIDDIYYYYSSQCESTCYSPMKNDHGSMVADIIAGKKYGVAPYVSIYGMYLNNDDDIIYTSDLIRAYEAIKSYISYDAYKLVINFSFSSETEYNDDYEFIGELLKEISKTAVIVSSAGNENVSSVGKSPCGYDWVICVGGIDNYIGELKTMLTKNYKKDSDSNYGRVVDIYAPISVYTSYLSSNNKSITAIASGTSFSAALVSGVAANIMSKDKNTKYTSKSMLQKLKSIGIKNAISGLPSGSNNLLLNNGKHTVYSKDDIYKGGACGAWAGNTICKTNECCSKYGYCGTSSAHCKEGCQKAYGSCK